MNDEQIEQEIQAKGLTAPRVSPENFDAEIGREIARENAISKIWPLMGYELRCRIALRSEEQFAPFCCV